MILSGVRTCLGGQVLPGIILGWRLQHADVGIPLMSSLTCFFFFKSTTSFTYFPAGTTALSNSFVWHRCSVYCMKGKPYQLRSEGQYSLTFLSPPSHWRSKEAHSYPSWFLGDRLGRKMAKTEPQLPKQAVQIRASLYNQCHIIKLPQYQHI